MCYLQAETDRNVPEVVFLAWGLFFTIQKKKQNLDIQTISMLSQKDLYLFFFDGFTALYFFKKFSFILVSVYWMFCKSELCLVAAN